MTIKIKPGLSIQDTPDGTIILDKEHQQIHQLNPVAAYIWKSIAEMESNIPEAICANFDIDSKTALQDYNQLLNEFEQQGLIINTNEESGS